MRVAVVGAGGVGGYFGGLLVRAGAQVCLLARGPHLAAVRAQGLTVRSELAGEWTVRPAATDDVRQAGSADLVLFCVKSYDLEAAAAQYRALLRPETLVIPVQNGIETVARLRRALQHEGVLAGLTYVAARLERPGVVVQRGRAASLIFGEPEGGLSARSARVHAVLQQLGFPCEQCADMPRRQWEKFVVICATAGVLAALRLPFGAVFSSPAHSALLLRVMQEVALLARAAGQALEAGAPGRLFGYLQSTMAPQAQSSQLTDLQEGRRLELDHLNGAAVRLGHQLGVPMPINAALCGALAPYAVGTARGSRPRRAGGASHQPLWWTLASS